MDVAIEIENGVADVVVEAGDLRADRGLRTAALVSLFCDARASADEIPVGADPRGWHAEDAGDPWGSKLWLLGRAKRTQETLELAKIYAANAFEWARRAGIIQRALVEAEYGPAGELGLTVRLVRGTSRRWSHLWTGEIARDVELPGVHVRFLPA